MSSSHYRGRFAPSPTGPLHLGSMLAAFGSWLLARHAGGQWLVRIEDVDRTREVPGAADHQLATLAAFGLQSDLPVVRQSARSARYAAALDTLYRSGHAFDCHCSRSALQDQGGLHHHCVATQARDCPAARLQVPPHTVIGFEDGLQGAFSQDLYAEVGDVVLRRADGCWAYQLAVVVDDAEQGITDVVRGADLIDSTPRQILLQRRLGLPTPRYLHLPLLLDAHGRKLSKSLAAAPVDGNAPLPTLRLLWQVLGQAPDALECTGDLPSTLTVAVERFVPERLHARVPAVLPERITP